MGGYICFAAARAAADRLAGLILIDTKAAADSDDARLNRKKTADGVAESGVGVAVDQMLPKMFAPKTYESNRALVDSTRVMMESSSRDGVIAALGAMASRPDSTPSLGAIRIPTLIVVGDADSIASPAEAKGIGSAIPGARVVTIADAGHLSNIEKPVEVNRAIESFLAEVYR
jgi:pimeloyl-ACP methyl ester carboxylesterase